MVNSKKIKIAVVTGTRAEYGLLYWLMHEIRADSDLELQLIVTGMHLSPEFGLTYQLIEADGFAICAKVEMLLSSDSSIGIAKSLALGTLGFVEAFERLRPDILIVLGDRFEVFAAAQTALVLKIPIAHIHGGELSEGAIDDAIRHAITKMAHLHFVAAEPYRKRVIQLGESPDRVFNVGTPGLERVIRAQLLSAEEWQKKVGFNLGDLNFLITLMPSTLETDLDCATIDALLNALDKFPRATLIFTKANADEGGRVINKKIDNYVANHRLHAEAFVTLGDLNYLSLLQFVDVVIGNSSSGIIEVPYFQKPTVNIGNRQSNRLKAESIIDCGRGASDIVHAIQKALSPQFKKIVKNASLAYRPDDTGQKIKNILKTTPFDKILIKRFYDLKKDDFKHENLCYC